MKVAGNKFDTQFEKVKPATYKLLYTGLYDTEVTVEGNAQHIISNILKQQL